LIGGFPPISIRALTICYFLHDSLQIGTINPSFLILGRNGMLRTITLGSAISVQGTFERALPDGRIVIRVDQTTYAGVPVTKAA
jgi:hypothetical protein